MVDLGDSALKVAVKAAAESWRDLEEYTIPRDKSGTKNEQWITSYVGARVNDLARRKVGTRRSIFVTYEAKSSWLIDHTGTVTDQQSKILTESSRFDVAVWNKKNFVEGLIEIKNAPGMDQKALVRDGKRLCAAIDSWGSAQSGSVKWGIFIYSCRLSSSQISKSNNIRKSLKEEYGKKNDIIVQKFKSRALHSWFLPADKNDPKCCMGFAGTLFR